MAEKTHHGSPRPRFIRWILLAILFSVPVAGALISFLDIVRDGVGGVDGLAGITDLAFDSERDMLFTVASEDHALASFHYDASNDQLVFLESFEDGTGGVFGLLGASGVTFSADGRHVYVTSQVDDTLAVFRRDATDDALAFLPAEVLENDVGGIFGLDGASAVAAGDDGSFVFVTAEVDDSLAAFRRDATQDDLTLADVEFDGQAPLRGASAVAVSPGSEHVYVAATVDDSIIAFASDDSEGLTYLGHWTDGEDGIDGLDGASAVAVSPDGKHVYATGKVDDSIVVFARDPATGLLTFNASYREGVDGIEGLSGATAVEVHSSGYWVLVASRYGNSVALFLRDTNSGSLELDSVLREGENGVEGIAGAVALALSYDHAYVAGHDDDAVGRFVLDTSAIPFFEDGFESGDTSAWSATAPLR